MNSKNTSIYRVIVVVLAMVMALGMTGCRKKVISQDISDNYMTALTKYDVKTLASLSENDKRATKIADKYKDDEGANRIFKLFLSNSSFEEKDRDYSSVNDSCVVTYELQMPDIAAASKKMPDTYEALEKKVKKLDTTTIEVVLELTYVDRTWVVENYDDVINNVYSDLYKAAKEFNYVDMDAVVESSSWVSSDNWKLSDAQAVYDGFAKGIEYEIKLKASIDDKLTYKLTFGGEEIKNGDVVIEENIIHIVYDEHVSDDGYLPTGNYSLTIYDSHGRTILEDACQVASIDYNNVTKSAIWQGCKDSDNKYSSDSRHIDLEVSIDPELYIEAIVNYYFNDELISALDTNHLGSYTYRIDAASMGAKFMPVGIYKIEITDRQGVVLLTSECEVVLDKVMVDSDSWDYGHVGYYTSEDDSATYTVNFVQEITMDLTYEIYLEDTTLVYEGEVEVDGTSMDITFALDDIYSEDASSDNVYKIYVYDENHDDIVVSSFGVEWEA